MKARIEVTAEDIRLGERLDSKRCAIARAIRRAAGTDLVWVNGDEVSVWVNGDGVRGCDTGGLRREHLPDRAQKFIHRFDEGLRVEPFTFDLEMPA